MTSLTKQQVIAFLESLSPGELRDLLHDLEERWGLERVISPRQAVAELDSTMGMPEFELVLLAHGDQRIAVMKVLRAQAGLPLREAMQVIDSLPQTIALGLSLPDARARRDQLRAVGARVEIR